MRVHMRKREREHSTGGMLRYLRYLLRCVAMKGDRENAVAKGKMERRRRKEGGGIGVVGRR